MKMKNRTTINLQSGKQNYYIFIKEIKNVRLNYSIHGIHFNLVFFDFFVCFGLNH